MYSYSVETSHRHTYRPQKCLDNETVLYKKESVAIFATGNFS